MKYTFKRGSNQYMRQNKGLRRYHKRLLSGYFLFIVAICIIAQYYKSAGVSEAMANGQIISPLPSATGDFAMVSEPTPVPQEPQIIVVEKKAHEASEKEQIIAYITRLWEKHGTAEVVHAINCFYSESGLRANAYGENTNGTNDAGVAQINSIHKLTVEERMDWKTNLDKAYQIYTSWGNSWDAWYGKSC